MWRKNINARISECGDNLIKTVFHELLTERHIHICMNQRRINNATLNICGLYMQLQMLPTLTELELYALIAH